MSQKFGRKIIYVKNGIEAVETWRINPDFDLIFMDITMLVMNGYKATRQIREFNKEVIIIAQTAYALDGYKEKTLDAGCNDYITKPIKKSNIKEVIQKYFGNQNKQFLS